MKYDQEGSSSGSETGNTSAGDSEALLRAEISFWRDLLSECDGSLPADSIERMRQALALAEHRFLQLWGMQPNRTASSDGPARTSRLPGGFLH